MRETGWPGRVPPFVSMSEPNAVRRAADGSSEASIGISCPKAMAPFRLRYRYRRRSDRAPSGALSQSLANVRLTGGAQRRPCEGGGSHSDRPTMKLMKSMKKGRRSAWPRNGCPGSSASLILFPICLHALHGENSGHPGPTRRALQLRRREAKPSRTRRDWLRSSPVSLRSAPTPTPVPIKQARHDEPRRPCCPSWTASGEKRQECNGLSSTRGWFPGNVPVVTRMSTENR